MSKIPIPNNEITAKDTSYRYMRDKVKLTKSGQNLILDNINDICTKQLLISTDVFIKVLITKLGQPIKNIGNNKYTIKNKTEAEIDTILEKFIIDIVCCKKCKLPEIELLTNTNRKCKSCGNIN